jgi:hypothetical protein
MFRSNWRASLDDVEERKKSPRHGGSGLGRKKSKPQQGLEGHSILYNDYFFNTPRDADKFWLLYGMSKELFMEILHGVREFDPYFRLKHEAVGTSGFL